MTSAPQTIDPRTMNGNDIVLSHFSLDRHFPIERRIAAAADAGLSAIGLYIGQYKMLRDEGRAPGELREMLDAAGLCLAEIEVVSGWAGDQASQDKGREFEKIAFEMADAFGCRYLQAIGTYTGTIAEAAQKFGRLCDEAADHGLVVGIEFLPFTNIFDAADAQRIAEAADRPNGGLCVDIWHHTRGSNNLDLIAALPGELVKGIQVSDGTVEPVHPDYYTDCLANRHPPGDAEFDLTGFIQTLDGIGANVPWSLEVCSAEGWATPDAGDWVTRCVNGMRTCLATARAGR
jgi:sugar phosphate isomerase/epimerase